MRDAASFIAGQTDSNTPAGVLTILRRALERALLRWNARRQLKMLTELDDHLLDDIGLKREDVRWALDLPFPHEPVPELQQCLTRSREHGWRG